MLRTLIASAALALVAVMAPVPAQATGGGSYPYEVTRCWEMDDPDMSNQTSIEWPQTLVGETCPTEQTCEGTKYQYDTYWIRDDDDAAYLAGLTHLNSPADDAQLEPHDYGVTYSAPNSDLCENPPPPTPTKKRASFSVTPYCNTVRVETRKNVAKIVHKTPNARKHVFIGHAKAGALFANGKTTKKVVAYEKRGGYCGGSSSS